MMVGVVGRAVGCDGRVVGRAVGCDGRGGREGCRL